MTARGGGTISAAIADAPSWAEELAGLRARPEFEQLMRGHQIPADEAAIAAIAARGHAAEQRAAVMGAQEEPG